MPKEKLGPRVNGLVWTRVNRETWQPLSLNIEASVASTVREEVYDRVLVGPAWSQLQRALALPAV